MSQKRPLIRFFKQLSFFLLAPLSCVFTAFFLMVLYALYGMVQFDANSIWLLIGLAAISLLAIVFLFRANLRTYRHLWAKREEKSKAG